MEFKGWSTTRNGAIEYQPGDVYTNDENVTLYAVWKAKTTTQPPVQPPVDPPIVFPKPTITGSNLLEYKAKTKLTGNHPDIVWGGSNEFIKVHPDGTVESLQNFTKTGKATVTATLGNQTATLEVKVEPTPLQWFLIIACFGWIRM